MVTYTEQAAYRHRDRLRRVVVLEGTPEASDDVTDVSLTASDAGLDSIDYVDFETLVLNSTTPHAFPTYNRTSNEVEFKDEDGTAFTGNLSTDGETFIARVVGPVE